MNKEIVQVGLDGHKTFSRVTARNAEMDVVWRRRLEHADRGAFGAALRALPPGTPVALESTFGWDWLSDEIAGAGLVPRLVHCGRVAAWRKARGIAKSNRTDADLLSELPSEKTAWWEVWLAPPAVRDGREWLRYRCALVAAQTAWKNRVHATLHRHGVLHGYSDLFGRGGRLFLEGLLDPEDDRLREASRETLAGQLRMVEGLRKELARVLRRLRRQLRVDPLTRRLMGIPGIGLILAHAIVAEIGDIERFGTYRKLASYALLVPVADDSGQEDPEVVPIGRHVGFAGRRTLKWAFIEAARNAVKHGGRWRALWNRRTNNGTRDRNRGYIAVAHALCRVVYVVWKKGVDYQEDPPARPGRRRRRSVRRARRSTRPGKGQPEAAMSTRRP